MPPPTPSRLTLAASALLGWALLASASLGSARADDVHAPPAPSEHPPVWQLEVHGGVLAPLERTNLCPGTTVPFLSRAADCVLGGGFSVGAEIERRDAHGLALRTGYQVWLTDAGSVFELGAVHTLELGFRWVIDDTTRVHPILEGSGAALLLTDPSAFTTAGAALSLGGGCEIELDAGVAVRVAAELWGLATGAFRTPDGVLRAADVGVNVVAQARAGIVVLLGDALAAP